jgi:hypothetical protein
MQAIALRTREGDITRHVAAYTCYEKYFAIHRNPDGRTRGPKAWTVTHIASGMALVHGRTRGHALCKLRVLLKINVNYRFFDDWSVADPEAEFPKVAHRYYQGMRKELENPTTLREKCIANHVTFSC